MHGEDVAVVGELPKCRLTLQPPEHHMSFAAVQDRTQEFRSCVNSVAKLHNRGGHAINRDQPSSGNSRSEFSLRASHIAQDISETTALLQKLAKLAQRKPMYDNNPKEISELTMVIKQRVNQINTSIAGLKQFASSQFGSGSTWGRKNETQLKEHSNNVVVLLQGKLTHVTEGFAEVLEARTKNIRASRNRTEHYLSANQGASAASESPLYASRHNNINNTGSSSQRGSADISRPHSSSSTIYAENPYSAQQDEEKEGEAEFLTIPQQEQTMALLEEQQDTYLSQRGTAVEAIESTIQELGSIFSQLAQMVAEQRETVQRIDANTEDISLNVSGAQRELLRYYARISSNRWLMIKIFSIVIFFFLIWALVS